MRQCHQSYGCDSSPKGHQLLVLFKATASVRPWIVGRSPQYFHQSNAFIPNADYLRIEASHLSISTATYKPIIHLALAGLTFQVVTWLGPSYASFWRGFCGLLT